jgi:hypothetical protein
MTIDDAINDLKTKIAAVSKGVEFKVVKMSAEEARLSVYVTAAVMHPIREATFQPVMDLLNKDGFDIQVLVYDKDHPPEIG